METKLGSGNRQVLVMENDPFFQIKKKKIELYVPKWPWETLAEVSC